MRVPQGANTIKQLLRIAKKTIPHSEWRKTPVVLKATAGLRLLPEHKARAILDEVVKLPVHTRYLTRASGWEVVRQARGGGGNR